MRETTAVRTLVKSAPELWAACSDAESLARHLGAFGEIRITRLEPETTVAWEGERASGTVTIESSSWGTKVTMTATLPDAVEDQPGAEVEPPAEVQPVAEVEAEPGAEAEPEPVADVEPEPVADVEPEPVAEEAEPVTPRPASGGRRPGLLARLAALFRGERPQPPPVVPEPPPEVVVRPESKPVPEPELATELQPVTEPRSAPEPEPASPDRGPAAEPETASPGAEAALDAALDSLGQAHHRPFSNF